jgi:micrococcal nuclease
MLRLSAPIDVSGRRLVLHAVILGSIALIALTGISNAQTKGVDSATVVTVLDADMLDVEMFDGRLERVRLIGIDSPNMADVGRSDGCFAEESHTALSKQLLHREVQLELDVQQRDDQGRLLAYVWHDTSLVNVQLVADGLAWPGVKYPNMTHSTEILAAYREAAVLKRGWWSACSNMH